MISGRFQKARVHGNVFGQCAPKIPALTQTPEVLPGQDGSAGRRAGWRRAERMREPYTGFRHAIDVRCRYSLGSRSTGMPVRLIVRNREKDIGTVRSSLAGGYGSPGQTKPISSIECHNGIGAGVRGASVTLSQGSTRASAAQRSCAHR